MPASKYIVITVLVLILVSLGSALRYLVTDQSDSKRTVRALTIRIGLSVALIIFLVVAAYMGWIEPNKVVCDTVDGVNCAQVDEPAESDKLQPAQ